jgi:hypothetical protein
MYLGTVCILDVLRQGHFLGAWEILYLEHFVAGTFVFRRFVLGRFVLRRFVTVQKILQIYFKTSFFEILQEVNKMCKMTLNKNVFTRKKAVHSPFSSNMVINWSRSLLTSPG